MFHKQKPLYEFLEKNKSVNWTKECEEAFLQVKEIVKRSNFLSHFDPNKEVFVKCDASPYGIGGVLYHMKENKEKPILFVHVL